MIVSPAVPGDLCLLMASDGFAHRAAQPGLQMTAHWLLVTCLQIPTEEPRQPRLA